ncbi:hypothetical protein QVD99_002543 [Batrachochytrium dendrobatidis]|nr:hypothetical protein QVD99_002543 [Batrachochytrium dendrobatidis]
MVASIHALSPVMMWLFILPSQWSFDSNNLSCSDYLENVQCSSIRCAFLLGIDCFNRHSQFNQHAIHCDAQPNYDFKTILSSFWHNHALYDHQIRPLKSRD